MDPEIDTEERLLDKVKASLERDIAACESLILKYGAFNVIANSVVHNQLQGPDEEMPGGPARQPTIPEYVALICLKHQPTLGIGELTNARGVMDDFYEIQILVNRIFAQYSFLHYRKFKVWDEKGVKSDIEHIAQSISASELLVRNPTFEEFHWDLLEELYTYYDDYFKDRLGFTISEAIAICLTIQDHMVEAYKTSVENFRKSSGQMYKEIMEYKYNNKKPAQFYPQDYLDGYIKMRDEDIKWEFRYSMLTYEMITRGDRMSFTVDQIAASEPIEKPTISRFLDSLSMNFGDVNPDFSKPEIIHPLKNKPLIVKDGQFICPSIPLLDYSLDKLFEDTLLNDSKKKEKYKQWRHDYLVSKGVQLLTNALNATDVYENLEYPGGEIDGLIMCDTNMIFIEGKSHRITDRAKTGYAARIETHIKQIVKASYSQALKGHEYLFGKEDVEFKDKKGKKVVLDGSKFINSYFISLTLDDISPLSCNIKVNNSLGLFAKDTFPWIVSLYDLRSVCEYMEGPSYLLQYLHRRKEFFRYEKFQVLDELDILGYYLKRNLRFDDIIKKDYEKHTVIRLESMRDEFNASYDYEYGNSKREVKKRKHFTIQPIKNLVQALEDSGLPFAKDAGVQILEFGSKLKEQLLGYIKQIKRRFARDGKIHDFRIHGNDVNDYEWMLIYCVGKDELGMIESFDKWVEKKYNEEVFDKFIAIFDVGQNGFKILKVHHLKKERVKPK
jgi:hypothetical protein